MGGLIDFYNTNFGQNYGGTGQGVSGILQGQLGNYQQYANQMQQIAAPLYYPAKPISPTPKKTGNLLKDLRREIDDWHGDILNKVA